MEWNDRWEYFNPNTTSPDEAHDDCTIRAICAVCGADWPSIAYNYFMWCYRRGCVPGEPKPFRSYLEELEFHEWDEYSRKDNVIKPTVRGLVNEYPTLTAILICNNHVVGVREGKYFDTWDSGGNKVQKVYIPPIDM